MAWTQSERGRRRMRTGGKLGYLGRRKGLLQMRALFRGVTGMEIFVRVEEERQKPQNDTRWGG
eukprot:1282040-Rhodomonas_salina.1